MQLSSGYDRSARDNTSSKVLGIMKEGQRISIRGVSISEGVAEKAASLKSMADFWWNHNVGFFRIADSDRHFGRRGFSMRTVVDEVGCGLIVRSGVSGSSDAMCNSKGSGEMKHD